MGHSLGLHFGLGCEDGVQWPACGQRACVRASDDACMYGSCRVMMGMRGER